MKTSRIISAIAALLITVTLLAASEINRPYLHNRGSDKFKSFSVSLFKSDGDLVKKDNKQNSTVQGTALENEAASASLVADLSYLRFDVTKYISQDEAVIAELPSSDSDYLRFDVNKYISETNEITELPVSDYNYLRFDANTFDQQNPVDRTEMPVKETKSFRFDVNQYITSDNSSASGTLE